MKKSKEYAKVLLSASVLPLVMDACSTTQSIADGDTTTQNAEKDKLRTVTMKTSQELEDRLNQLAKEEYKGERFPGAMCYAMASPIEEEFQCPICGSKIISTNYEQRSLESIKRDVDIIKTFGYDAILVCTHKQATIETYQYPPEPPTTIADEDSLYINTETKAKTKTETKEVTETELTFKIRFSDKEDYHVVNSNIESDYDILVAFLKGAEIRKSFNDATIPLHDNIDVIKKMTGLGKGISSPKK